MSEKGIVLHYIRGMHFIDKLFKEVVKDKYDKKSFKHNSLTILY